MSSSRAPSLIPAHGAPKDTRKLLMLRIRYMMPAPMLGSGYDFRHPSVDPRHPGGALQRPGSPRARRWGGGMPGDGLGLVRRCAVRQSPPRRVDATRGGGGTARTGAARPRLYGLVRAAQPARLRLPMGLPRRAVERPHPPPPFPPPPPPSPPARPPRPP